ncbi:MAG: ribosome maturation factor RimM [Alphaproteobacteria bacterium]|nr:ribosome maturation factor RimM [Alphaproteobacteria bacterium]
MSDNKKILVGKIVAPQGIRGDVRVQTYTTTPDDLKKMSILSDKFTGPDFKFIRRLNPNSDVIIAHINGIDDRDSAEQLRNTELFVMRDTLPELRNDEYYQTDLIGFGVMRAGAIIGRIECFHNFGGGDIIELDNGEMLSFIGADVNIQNKVVMVK